MCHIEKTLFFSMFLNFRVAMLHSATHPPHIMAFVWRPYVICKIPKEGETKQTAIWDTQRLPNGLFRDNFGGGPEHRQPISQPLTAFQL